MYKVFLLGDKNNNCGDTLSKPILEHFLNSKVELTGRSTKGKILGVGSVMSALRENDVVWGTGCIRNKRRRVPKGVKILALRGKMTARLLGVDCKTFGDPALLLPLIYNPEVEKKYGVGYIPHYVDKPLFEGSDARVIDIQQDWKRFVNEIKECKKIISSSLHGLIIAEAYGIPVEWQVYSDKVIGKGFKFRDYLTGTGRKPQEPGVFPPLENLEQIQEGLIEALGALKVK